MVTPLVGQVWEEELAYSLNPPILWLIISEEPGGVRILNLESGEETVYADWLFKPNTPDSWVRRIA